MFVINNVHIVVREISKNLKLGVKLILKDQNNQQNLVMMNGQNIYL